jgi:hypothetical protein
MMTLDKFVAQLVALQKEGHGNLPVFYRHGASGDCGELSYAHVTDEIEDTGPFDVTGSYISIYAGH